MQRCHCGPEKPQTPSHSTHILHSHIHVLSDALSHTHSHLLNHTVSLSLTPPLTHTHSLPTTPASQIHTRPHICTLKLMHIHSLSCTLTLPTQSLHIFNQPHICTHKFVCIHTHTHSRAHSHFTQSCHLFTRSHTRALSNSCPFTLTLAHQHTQAHSQLSAPHPLPPSQTPLTRSPLLPPLGGTRRDVGGGMRAGGAPQCPSAGCPPPGPAARTPPR